MFNLSRLLSIGRLLESFSRPSSRGPLPEVREVDWSEWESCLSDWQGLARSPATTTFDRLDRLDRRR